MAELFVEVIGWVGAALLLMAYFLIASRRLHGRSKIYHTMNLIGGASIGINSLLNSAYPAAALNLIWSGIAVFGLYKSLTAVRS